MIRKTFEIPLYKIRVTLLQVESREDADGMKSYLRNIGAESDDFDDVIHAIENRCVNGGDTFRALRKKKILVIFYPFTDTRHQKEIFSHEKRHIEDRVLQFCSVNDIESAGLLAGFLGEKFWEFEQMIQSKQTNK